MRRAGSCTAVALALVGCLAGGCVDTERDIDSALGSEGGLVPVVCGDGARTLELPGSGANAGQVGAARDVNHRGEIVGALGGRAASWSWQETGWRYLALGTWPGDDTSVARALNDSGVVVGTSYAGAHEARAVVWQWGQVFSLVPLRPGDQSEANDVNRSGQIVGHSVGSSGMLAVQWDFDADPPIRSLSPLDGDDASWARAINSAGQVAGASARSALGSRAVRWEPDGTVHELETLPDEESEAVAINDAGSAVGWAAAADGTRRAVAWDPEGNRLELGAWAGADESAAEGISDRGEIVGSGGDYTGWVDEEFRRDALFWESPGRDPSSLQSSEPVEIADAFAINRNGLAVGVAGDRPVLWCAREP